MTDPLEGVTDAHLQAALALVNEVQGFDCGVSIYHVHNAKLLRRALCRAIEQHEAFRQEVSDAIDSSILTPETEVHLGRFILPKPDPLVEALDDLEDGRAGPTTESYAACLREAIEKRGGKIVWGEG
jgi:hypothetical protein